MPNFVLPIVYVLAFLAVVLLVQGVGSGFFSVRDRSQKVNRRLSMLHSGADPDDVFSALVRKSSAPDLGSASFVNLYERVDHYCRQAGISVTPLRLAIYAAGLTGFLWVISLFVVRSSSGAQTALNSIMSLVGAAALSILAVYAWVSHKRRARLKQIEAQMPLALDIVNRAVRAGHPVVSAVQLAADELGDPIGTEFGLIVDETTYGAEFRDALRSFAVRTGSSDAHFFAVAVAIQSETGGNLAEILEGLATVIRGRATLGKRIKALASEGKASALILSALPILLIGFMLLFQPRFYTDKFSDPVFWPTAAVIGALYLVGQIMLRRIVNFRF